MPDFISKEKRSKIMTAIKGKNTKVEMILRKELHRRGHRYRIHYNLLGKPDIVFPSKKLAVFVDGDFWHGYNWKKLGKVPPNKFWKNKIKNNISRDKKVNNYLRKEGWNVIRIWEHEINSNLKEVVKNIENEIKYTDNKQKRS